MSNYNQEETSYPSLGIMRDILGSTKYQHWYEINRNNCKNYWNPYEELEIVARKEIEKWRKNKK